MCNDYGNKIPYSDYLVAFSQTRIPVKWPDSAPNLEPREDIWPTERAPVIPRLEDRTNEFLELRWGFPPARPKGLPVINFRSEGRRFPVGRCLIPASHFFEFTGTKSPKTKCEIHEGWRGLVLLRRSIASNGGGWRSLHAVDDGAEPGCRADPRSANGRAGALRVVSMAGADWDEADLLRALPAGSLKVEQVR